MKRNSDSSPSICSVAYLPHSPVGKIGLASSEDGLLVLEMQIETEDFEAKLKEKGYLIKQTSSLILEQAIDQLENYFNGRLECFDVPIAWQRFTPFQEKVLHTTFAIPYGQVKSYAEIAQEVGQPRAARAVGQVEARNPLPIIIPCHRVIGSDGSLHGYGAAGGLETKARLLELEGVKVWNLRNRHQQAERSL